MTNTIDVKQGEKVPRDRHRLGLPVAYLSHLTEKIWSIEIIKALAGRTRGIYDDLISRGYQEFAAITTRNADGYYGWEENAPFDKIIVTCGIDHIPALAAAAQARRHHGDSGGGRPGPSTS